VIPTSTANELAREALIKIIVAKMRAGRKRRYDVGLSPNHLWRVIHGR
jgi:hypothetical protein